MIDSTLSWHTHIENISRGIGLLYIIRPFVNIKTLKTLYYSLIYPHLLYAIEVWGSAVTSDINSLLVLQKRIIRLLSNSDTRHSDYSFPPSNPLFFKEQLLKVQDIFKSSPVNVQLWFRLSIRVHNHNTRSQYISLDKSIYTNNLFIPTARTSHYGPKLIKVQGPKIWNEIPPTIRNSISSNIFIKKYKQILLQSYNIH